MSELLLIPTPIGNLDDLSAAMRTALGRCSVLACEDTRVTRTLLSAAGISTPRLEVLNAHTERGVCEALLDRVQRGEVVGMVTDAGTPCISDPGSLLVNAAHQRGVTVRVIPGPSAVTTAIAGSGFDCARFRFLGFLPRKGRDREQALAELSRDPDVTVIFESPKRVVATLIDLARWCEPTRRVSIARELSKRFEQRWVGTVAEAADWAENHQRGEFVLMIDRSEVATSVAVDEAMLTRLVHTGLSTRDLAAVLSVIDPTGRGEWYDRVVESKRRVQAQAPDK